MPRRSGMPQPPYAVALNTGFVPKSQYAHQPLPEGGSAGSDRPGNGEANQQ